MPVLPAGGVAEKGGRGGCSQATPDILKKKEIIFFFL